MKHLLASFLIGFSLFHIFFSSNSYAFGLLKTDSNDIFADRNEDPIAYLQEDSNNKHYFRALIEVSTILAAASAYYWGTRSFASDFDYSVSFDTLGKKFSGKAVLFDDNTFDINLLPGHGLVGAYYYLIARNNNLSRLEAFLLTSIASSVFETFIEFPEVASINDLIVTSFGGAPIGESMYKFGRYFRCSRNRDTLLYKIMAAATDPVALLNSFIWKDVNYKFSGTDVCNFTLIQSEFSIFSGVGTVYYENTNHAKTGVLAGFYGKLYLLPHYGTESNVDTFVKDTALVQLSLETLFTGESIDSLRVFFKTVWAAYHRQNIAKGPAGQLTGYSFFVGPASAFEYAIYETGEFTDQIGAVHILGPAMEWTFFHQGGYLRLGLDVFGDFALIRSFAFDKYKANHSLDGIKSVLRRENYYDAYGFTINPKIETQHGAYRFVAEYKYSHYDSWDGADRNVHLTNDFHLVDKREEYRLTFGRLVDFFDTKFFKTNQIWLEAAVERRSRSGFIADDAVSHHGGNTWFMFRCRIIP